MLKTHRKNVHAFVVGRLVDAKGAFGIDHNGPDLPLRLRYDPYAASGRFEGAYTGTVVNFARAVLLNEHGITACYAS